MKHSLHNLEEGQLWRLEQGYLRITELGGQHIRYKMLRNSNVKTAMTQLIRVEALLNFLRQSEAELVCDDEQAGATPIAAAA